MRSDDPGSAAPPKHDPKAPSIPDDAVVIDIAQLIDQQLVRGWVADKRLQTKPHPELASTATVQAKVGQKFTVKLNNVNDTYELKTAEALDSRIAVQRENGSKDGLFSFVALEPGKTNVRMRVAHSKTLAIAEIEAAVVVS
jgi:hypothetical protein